MARPEKSSIFERKLQELERQRELIDGDIRSLSKSIRKIDEGGSMPPLRSRSLDTLGAGRAANPAPAPEAETPQRRREAAAAQALDRALGTLSGTEVPSPAAALGREPDEAPAAPNLVVDTRRRAAPAPPRFANYFASGSFGNSRPLAEERRIQRNKAIFMIIVVLLLLSIAVRFIF